jgi:UDPglucose 6-dehydrogenase
VVAEQCNYEFGLLTEVMRVNSEQRLRFLKKIRNALWTLRGKRLGVLGLAFKADTDDIRESPALEIISALLREGAQICAYDPVAVSKAKEVLDKSGMFYATDPYTAATGCDAVLILTEWKQFAQLDLKKLRSVVRHPIVIDGRNLYRPADMAYAGFVYHSIGRSVAIPVSLPVDGKSDSVPRESETRPTVTADWRQEPSQPFAP